MTITDAAWWRRSAEHSPPAPHTRGVCTSRYIALRDGTRLAADVWLPEGLAHDARVPALISFTPYVRGMRFRFGAAERLFAWLGLADTLWGEAFARHSYAFLAVEIRGAGASFGTKTSIFHDQLLSDSAEVFDWIVAQPWSNGAIGATGISALGLTSMFAGAGKHPALKAIAPRFTVFDVFASVHPGGLLENRFLTDIGVRLRAMDSNRLADGFDTALQRALLRLLIRGIRGVDEDADGSLLEAAVREHAENEGFDRDIAAVRYRDDRLPHSRREATLDTQSPHSLIHELCASGLPVYAYGGWYDGAFQREMIHLHLNVPNPGSRLVLGPWAHGGRFYSSPLVREKRRADFDQAGELVRFFDLHLRGVDRGVRNEAPVHYFTMVEERWKEAGAWPPPGTTMRAYWLAPESRLATGAPERPGKDRYPVDRTATTGVWSRYGKHLSGGMGPARYPDRRTADRKLFCYTSEPLDADLEVTGHPLVTLSLACDTEDAALFVYLEDVAPDGDVLMVTDAGLRLSLRRVGDDPPYRHLGVWRPGRSLDIEPVVPGERMEIALDLLPTSWLFRAGHSIRLAIAGADAENFVQVPEQGPAPTFTLYHGGQHAARLELPVMLRGGGVAADQEENT